MSKSEKIGEVFEFKDINEKLRTIQRLIDGILSGEYLKPSWTKTVASSVTLEAAASSSTAFDLQTESDGNIFTVEEASANAGQNLIVGFNSVDEFDFVRVKSYYDGQISHELQIQVEASPFDGSMWHDFKCMNPDHDYMSDYSFLIPDDTPYINSGVVKVRFLHNESGNSNDDWFFDVVALYKGGI